MFLGHFAMGLAAKGVGRRVPLGLLMMAALASDLLWPALLLLGIERMSVVPGTTRLSPLHFEHYPYSHSLLASALMGALIALAYYVSRRDRAGALALLAAGVTHWLLDVLSHAPDMPIAPWMEARLGLGLWNSLYGTLMVEGGLFVASIAIYLRVTRALDRLGTHALWTYILALAAIYASSLFGPPPPDDAKMIAAVGLSTWLLIAWAWWADRHRALE